MKLPVMPGDPAYPPDEVLAAACKVRDWMTQHGCVSLNGLMREETLLAKLRAIEAQQNHAFRALLG